jgi:hypothetical protein
MNRKLLTGLAAIALASAALTTISAIEANAASPACGASCLTLASQRFGVGFVGAGPPGVAAAGQRVTLGPAGPYLREDWQADYLGPASLLARVGIIPLAIGKAWPDDPAYQYVYTPGGQVSDLCLAVRTTAVNGTPVVLEPCGVSADTVWITMLNSISTVFTPLINGTDTRDANPYVLTASTISGELYTHELVPFSSKVPSPYQMWQTLYGVLP